ncbi:nuclear transport factor 2 family protein [Devosia sediminis]|uniref:Nuclear transport factor 2 family protein n=1 Tax=Devosia sediminis TaxID=2798801 RepID=A0A934MLC0_9HYPH|nr:nuclear transport factor 2 family protein [Devosia sediminis]MBJ3784471.1 nuclear transport factor 2 family protein [Devosia sediminis]
MTKMTPLECVTVQFEAYNRRDLETFLSVFADGVQTYRLPDMTLMLDGKAAFGDFYAANRFVHEGLRAELVNRIVTGNTVIDHELIHGLGPEPMEATVMFHVADGLIQTVFSIPAKTPS